jgi:isocitrate lyase
MGYKFQFVTLAGFHSLSVSMFELAKQYAVEGMAAYVRVQRKEFEAEPAGYTAVKHQAFVGTEYFDEVANVISSGMSSTTAMGESTETAQFKEQPVLVPPPVSSTKSDRDRDRNQ